MSERWGPWAQAKGGDTPQASYAAVFGPAVSQLYATAEAGG